MQAPQEQGGHIYYNTGVYTNIVPDERIEFTQSLSDAYGIPIDPADGPHFKFNEAVSFYVNCATQEEVDDLWEKLTAGGGEPGGAAG